MSDASAALLGVIVGSVLTAGLGLVASRYLQKREFDQRRLDEARLRVYGPLAWDLENSASSTQRYDHCPVTPTYDEIMRTDHLEWMIRSKELQSDLRTLYRKEMPQFNETRHKTVDLIREKLSEDLLQQIGGTVVQPRTVVAGNAYVKFNESVHPAKVKQETDHVSRALALPLLRGDLKIENIDEIRFSYRELPGFPRLQHHNLDDYFNQRAVEVCREEIEKASKAMTKLLERIREIQGKINKLLEE